MAKKKNSLAQAFMQKYKAAASQSKSNGAKAHSDKAITSGKYVNTSRTTGSSSQSSSSSSRRTGATSATGNRSGSTRVTTTDPRTRSVQRRTTTNSTTKNNTTSSRSGMTTAEKIEANKNNVVQSRINPRGVETSTQKKQSWENKAGDIKDSRGFKAAELGVKGALNSTKATFDAARNPNEDKYVKAKEYKEAQGINVDEKIKKYEGQYGQLLRSEQDKREWRETALEKDQNKADKINAEYQELKDKTKSKVGKFALDVVKTGSEMAVDAGTSLVTGTGPVGYFGSMASRVVGQSYLDAKSRGATDDEAAAYAFAEAGKEVGTEGMFAPAGKLGKTIFGGGYAGSVAGDLSDKVANKLTGNVTGKFLKDIVYGGTKTGFSMLEEGIEEMVSEGLDPMVANALYQKSVTQRNQQQFRSELDQKVKSGEVTQAQADAYYEQNKGKLDITTQFNLGDVAYSGLLGGALGMLGGGVNSLSQNMAGARATEIYGDKGIKKLAEGLVDIDETPGADVSSQAKAVAQMIKSGETVSNGQVAEMVQAAQQQQQRNDNNFSDSIGAAQKIINDNGHANPVNMSIQPDENGNPQIVPTLSENTAKVYAQSIEDGKQAITNVLDENGISMSEEQIQSVGEAIADVQMGLALDSSTVEMFTLSHPAERAALETALGIKLPETNEGTRSELNKMIAENLVETAKTEDNTVRDQLKGLVHQTEATGYGRNGQMEFASRLGDDQIDAMSGSQVMGYAETFDEYYRSGMSGDHSLEEMDGLNNPTFMAVPEGVRRAAYTAGMRDRISAQNLLNGQLVEKGESITKALQKAKQSGPKASGTVTFEINNENRKSLGYARSKMWQSVANALGIDIVLADVENMQRLGNDDKINSGTNGFYNPKTGAIVINIDAARGLDYTLIHEVTHYIRLTAPAEYNKLASLVVDRWSRRGGMMNAIEQKKKTYDDLTDEQILEEIIADSTYEFLLDEGFVEEVAKSSPTLAQRLLEAIRYVAKRLRAMIADGNLPDLRNEDLFSQLDILKEAETLWLDAYKKAVENSVAADGITRMNQSQLDNEYQKAYEDGDIRYSKSINYESDIDEWVSEGRGNNYPAIVTGSTSNIMQGVGAIEQDIYILPWKINKILEEHPEITIDNIKQIPDVLENPSLILKSSNGYSANNTRVVAFGNVKTATGFMNVVLDFSPVENKTAITDMQKVVSTYTKGDKNLSALRNLIENSEVIYLDNKKATKLLQSIGFTKRPIELLDSGFIGSVSYSKRSVNISGPLFSTLMEDAESKMFDGIRTSQSIDAGYLAAVERGDMDAAQAMVDQAAEERGYATNLYHGTPNKFTVFDPELVSNGKYWGRGIYLTDRMDSAKQFAVDYTTGVVGDTMSLMADLGNSLVIDIESEADKAKVRSMLGKRKNAKLSVDNFRRYINETVWGDWYNAEYGDTTKLGNPKYDSVVVKNSYDRGGGKFDEYIVFNSERIKSADPVTYDNNGNVIPLSQRFNTENNDIRYSQTDSEGNTLTDGQIEYFKGSKVRDENGRLIPMYHGTNSPGFTIFDPLKTDDNRSLFFTSDPMVANTYTYAQNKGHDINPYDMISGESSANDFNRIMESVDGRDRAILLDESMLPEYEDRLNDLLSDENSYQSDIDRYQATVDGIKSHSGEYAEMFIYGDEGIPTLTRNTDDSDFGTESEVVSSLYERVRGFNAPNRYKTYLNLTNPLIIDATRQYAGKHDVYVENDRISGVVDISVDGNLVGSFYSEKEADDFIKNAFTDDADEIISEYKENVVYDSHINVNLNQSGHWRHIAISQDKVVEDLKLEYVDDEHYNLVATMGDGSVKRFDNQTDTELIQAQKSLGLEYPNVNILEGISNILRRRANIDKLKDLYGEELDEHARSYISSYTFGELEEAQPGNINKTRGWSEYAQKNGYDGVIFKNLKDIGAYSGGLVDNASTIAIAFDPNQVKSVQNENPTSGPDIRFSAATEKNDYPKAANPMTGSSVLMENGSAVMISGRKARENAMRDNGFSEVAIKNVNDYFDSMISFIQDDLGIKYRFIGLNDVKNAKVKVRYKNGEPDSIIMSAMLKNGEYPVNFDFSAICKKREGMMQVIKALVNTPTSNGSNVFNSIELTDEQMWKINNALREEGFETACLGCFVEARRYNSHKFYNKIETVWNEKVRKARKKLGLPEEEYFNFADTNKALTEITDKDMQSVEDVWAAYEESTASKKSPNKRIQLLMDTIVKNKDVNSPYLKLISPSDVLTPEGIEGFKTLSTKDHDLVKTIKSFYGTSAPKEILAFTPYNSEIAMLPEKKGDMSIRDYLKSIGGVRTQSFSDFKIENFFDYMQMIADMAARKFTGHAYTKEISFAKIFGKTGMKINLSVMFDIDNEFCKKYGKQYAGLQFIDEADLNTDKYFTDKSIPYSERKGKRYAKAHTLSDGRTGYLVYLVGDKARSDAIFEENYQKNLKAKMTEERARELANMSRPFTQSIDMDEAIELQNRDGYRENVGIIAVAYSDEHMKMLLEDPEIRYIIPYHKSGLPKFVSNKSNMDYALDFTKTQNTNKNAGIKKPNGKKFDTKHELSTIKKNKDIKYPYIELYKRMNDEGVTYAFGKKSTAQKTAMAGTADYDVYEHLSNSKDPKAVVNEYLKYCEDNNYIPIFPEYAGSEGYYKVLFDFSITDGNEVYEQREVTNTYPAANNSVVDITQETGNLDELKSIIDSAAEEQNNLNMERNQKMGKVVDKLLRPDSDYNLLEGTNIQAIKYDEIDYSNPKYTLQGEDEPDNQLRRSQNTEDEPLPEDVIYDYMADHPEEFEQMWTSVPEDSNYVQHRAETLESLKTQVQKLKQNQKKTEGKILDESSVRSDFNDMVKAMLQASSEGRGTKKTDNKLVKQVVNNSKIMFNYFHSGDTENMTLTALSAAEDMVDGLRFINDDVYTYYKDLRDYLKAVPVKVADTIKSDIPDYAEWKKAQWGRIRIANEGIPVDVMYGELCGMFPDMFDSAISNPTDMLLRMGEAMEEVQPYAVYLSSEERAALVSQVASDMIRITMLGKPYQSMVDRYEDKLKAAKQRATEAERDKSKYQRELWKANERTAKADDKLLAQQMAAGREKAALNNQIDAERELRKEKVKAVREDRDAKIKKLQEKQKAKEQARKAARERAKSWEHLQDDYKWLASRLIKPNDQKHIPEEFRAALAGFLQNLDLQTERSKELELKYGKVSGATQNLINLRTRLGEIAKEDGTGPLEYDGYVFELMDAMLKKMEGPDEDVNALDELTDQTLREVSTILRSIKHGIDNVDKARTEGQKKKISELAESVIQNCNGRIALYGKYKVRQNFLAVPEQILNESMVTPRDMFELLGGGMEDVFMGIRHGFDKHVDNIDTARHFFESVFRQYENKKKPGSKVEAWRGTKGIQEFTLVNGNKVQMSVAQMMSLYCSSKRPQAATHIAAGGIVLTQVTDNNLKTVLFGKPKEIQNNRIPLTPIDVEAITNQLTQEQKNLANALMEFLNTTCSEWGNETSMLMYGYKKFTEPDYFPIKSARQFLDTSFDVHDTVEKIKNFGFTKATVADATNPIVIDDIFSVVANHINQMSLYNALAAPISDFQRVYNYKAQDEHGLRTITVNDSLQSAYGEGCNEYIRNFIEDLQNQQKLRRDPMDELLNKLLANYKKATIGFNLRVALQQPTAVVRAFAMINPKYFTDPRMIDMKTNMAEMKEHCQIAKWKSWGFNQIDLANSIEDIMMNREWSKEDLVTMAPYGLLDNATWSLIWVAVKNETKAKHPEVTYESAEFFDICSERAAAIFDKTQVVDSPLHRSQIMRKKDMMTKMIVSFMAEPTRTYNMMRSAMSAARLKWKTGDKAGAKKMVAKYAIVYVLNAAACGYAAAIADAIRHAGDDDDKGYIMYGWLNTWSNIKPWNLVPLAKEIESYMEGWGTSNMAFEGVAKFVVAGKAILVDGDTSPHAFGELLNAFGYLTGKPIKNFRRELKAIFGVEVFASTDNLIGSKDETSETEVDGSIFSTIKGLFGNDSDSSSEGSGSGDGTSASSDEEAAVSHRTGITMDDIDYGMYSYLHEDNSTKGLKNKVMNLLGKGDTEEETNEKQFNKAVSEAKESGEGKKGQEYLDAVYKTATKGYTNILAAGDTRTIKEMRRVLEAAGGDVDKFDQMIIKNAKTALKKNIGSDGINLESANNLNRLLNSMGYSDEEISSEVVAKTDTAKELQKALAAGDEEEAIRLCHILRMAGLSREDFDTLYDKRWDAVDAETVGTFSMPASGYVKANINSGYMTAHRPDHAGVDIAMPTGTEISASDGGEVIAVGWGGALGKYIDIKHDNGYVTRYQHLSWYDVEKGQKIAKGQYIGKSGNTGNSTGPHLHFAIYRATNESQCTHANSVDPAKFLE